MTTQLQAESPRVADTGASRPPSPLRPATLGAAAGLLLAAVMTLLAPSLRDGLSGLAPSPETPLLSPDELAGEIERADHRIEAVEQRLNDLVPRRGYLVVSSADNTFRLMQGREVLREGLCSTGSYVHLRGGDGREWLFHTPRGAFRVRQKRRDPVWVKPDWAFVEAGEPVPPPGAPERFERGMLGDYALSLGDGYLIHGTLYQRLLGRPVTHGCVRLGDEDLEAVYSALPVGAPIYIY